MRSRPLTSQPLRVRALLPLLAFLLVHGCKRPAPVVGVASQPTHVASSAPLVDASLPPDALVEKPVEAGPATERCTADALTSESGTRCLCAGRPHCALEKWIDGGDSAIASVVLAKTSAPNGAGQCWVSEPRAELWLLKKTETAWVLRLLTTTSATGFPGCTLPVSFDELALKNGVLVHSGSHPWREAHDSNLTAHRRIRIRLDTLQFEQEEWSWRRCCATENGVTFALGFATSCMDHRIIDPWKLEARFDHDRGLGDGKTCAPGKGLAVPELPIPGFATAFREPGAAPPGSTLERRASGRSSSVTTCSSSSGVPRVARGGQWRSPLAPTRSSSQPMSKAGS